MELCDQLDPAHDVPVHLGELFGWNPEFLMPARADGLNLVPTKEVLLTAKRVT